MPSEVPQWGGTNLYGRFICGYLAAALLALSAPFDAADAQTLSSNQTATSGPGDALEADLMAAADWSPAKFTSKHVEGTLLKNQSPIFLCKQNGQHVFSLWISDHTKKLLVNLHGIAKPLAANNVKQHIIANAHGDSTIISMDASNKHVEVFVDTNFYESNSSVIIDGGKEKLVCDLPLNAKLYSAGPGSIGLFNLLSAGAAQIMSTPPDWPQN